MGKVPVQLSVQPSASKSMGARQRHLQQCHHHHRQEQQGEAGGPCCSQMCVGRPPAPARQLSPSSAFCPSRRPRQRLLSLLLLSITAACALLPALPVSAAQEATPAQAPTTHTPIPRVAIVSEKAFHLEVLAGFISILQADYGKHMVVYMHPMNFEGRSLDFGFAEFLQGEFDSNRIRGLPWVGIPQFEVVIFLSPEYRVDYVREFIRQARPKVVIMMVHNGDARDVPLLQPSHPNAHLMTLSPHVQRFVAQRLNTTLDWMLPLKALNSKTDCAPTNLTKCLSGFAIQVCQCTRTVRVCAATPALCKMYTRRQGTGSRSHARFVTDQQYSACSRSCLVLPCVSHSLQYGRSCHVAKGAEHACICVCVCVSTGCDGQSAS